MKTDNKTWLGPVLFSFVCLMLVCLGIAAVNMTDQIAAVDEGSVAVLSLPTPLVSTVQ